MVVKIKAKEVEATKKQLMVEQGFKCKVCGGSLTGIPLSKLALDHCHETGHVRGTLHMGCNRAEGVIGKALHSWSGCTTFLEKLNALKALAVYWEENRRDPKPWIHHTHKTPEQQKEALIKKRKAALKKRATVKRSAK